MGIWPQKRERKPVMWGSALLQLLPGPARPVGRETQAQWSPLVCQGWGQSCKLGAGFSAKAPGRAGLHRELRSERGPSTHPHLKYAVTYWSVKDPPERIKRDGVHMSCKAQINVLQTGWAESVIFHGALVRELQKVLHQLAGGLISDYTLLWSQLQKSKQDSKRSKSMRNLMEF